jgi:hypothetical protein
MYADDLQRIFDLAGANGLKLNPKKSQVILIHRSRAQIPQPELYIGSDVVTIVNNLGFCSMGISRQLITLRGFVGEFILLDHMPHTRHFSLGKDLSSPWSLHT